MRMLSSSGLMTLMGQRWSQLFCYDFNRHSDFVLWCCLVQGKNPKDPSRHVLFLLSSHSPNERNAGRNEHTVMIHHYLMRPGVLYQGGPVFRFSKSACLMSAFPCWACFWHSSTLLSCM